ncbi:MAG: PAS domain S-box protein [Candidatus Thorarchaeota archaeon]
MREEYAEAIAETIREPLLVMDADIRVISANRSFYQSFNMTKEETEGKSLYDLGERQWDIPRLRALLEEILPLNTEMRDFEMEHVFENIGAKFMLLNARRIYREKNKTQMILLAIEDITERKNAEREERAAREYAEAIVETIREPLLVMDADIRVISANRSFYQSFNMTKEETEGKSLYDLGERQWDIPRLRALLEEILPLNTEMRDFEMEHVFENIGAKFMLLNARRIYREKNKTQMILLAIEDITERKNAERAATVAGEQAIFYLDLISHDIRNHLQAIVLGTEILGHFDLGPEIDPVFGLIVESVHSSKEVIRKIQATRGLYSAPFFERSLEVALKESLEVLRNEFPDVQVFMKCDVHREIVIADQYLEILLTNLLENAVIHNNRMNKQIWVELVKVAGGYEVTIADNGPGIPNDRKISLLDPTRRYGGVGIHQAKQILSKYGGRLSLHDRVYGEPEQGAMFRAWFPNPTPDRA